MRNSCLPLESDVNPSWAFSRSRGEKPSRSDKEKSTRPSFDLQIWVLVTWALTQVHSSSAMAVPRPTCDC